MDEAPAARTCLYDTAQLGVVIDDMARQAAGLLLGREKLAVVGMLRRGAPLADRLTDLLVRRHGLARPLRLDLSVKRYADDLRLLYPQTELTESAAHTALDLARHTLLVVDDVLYTGHSLLRVVEYLARKQPAEILVAMLADRGATHLPVRAQVVGVRLDVAPGSVLECHVPPYEPDFGIVLVQPRAAPEVP